MNHPANIQSARVAVFRVDASLEIGSGHVMRCLTLAEALREQGAQCHFLCREHPGHLIEAIEARGFSVHRLSLLSAVGEPPAGVEAQFEYAKWLGATWREDAEACGPLLARLMPDWLVVDHYALDARWEAAVLPERTRLLVIDDLADRAHVADLLLDQNLGRKAEDYEGRVPEHCHCLIGPRYALLRPEFACLREASLARRRSPHLRELLITMGGVDKDNVTAEVLNVLSDCPLPQACRIIVVMGASAPWLEAVKAKAAKMPWPTDVVANVPDIAERMVSADLAIGAAGSTSWERCCLGLPTLMVALAENQRPIAEALDSAGAALHLRPPEHIHGLAECLATVNSAGALQAMSFAASQITAGQGVMMMCEAMRRKEKIA